MCVLRNCKIRTTLYHPSSNGLVERAHRSLKASHGSLRSTLDTSPSFVLLGLRSVIKETLMLLLLKWCTEQLYPSTQLFFQDTGTNNVSSLCNLKQTLHNIKPVPTSSHGRKLFCTPRTSLNVLTYFTT
ncbi:hypothetical protein TNIN_489831 [Trichonephila inaurata madagascariensis]|uniref:Integrase catalytic domain-containing protein n=1 Tax=Trichonephila inaurata madagascariensis TaxID=2747483 RepID=A0A8X6WR78_9ARAC|nr:hypothetical protein TNIN_489831 [Trichonephila inaurata madagascariensis]